MARIFRRFPARLQPFRSPFQTARVFGRAAIQMRLPQHQRFSGFHLSLIRSHFFPLPATTGYCAEQFAMHAAGSDMVTVGVPGALRLEIHAAGANMIESVC